MPTIVSSVYNSGATQSTTHTVPVPTNTEGDLLILVVQCGSLSSSSATATGCMRVARENANAGRNLLVFARSVGTTSVFTVDVAVATGAQNAMAHVYVISGATTTIADIDVSSAVFGNGFEDPKMNPPSLTSTSGSVEHIWLALCAGIPIGGYSGGPTSYTTLLSQNLDSSPDDNALASAYRVLTAETEDPNSFTSTATNPNSVTLTLAIPVIASGPDYTARKGSTETITHALTADGITTATLNGETVTIGTQSGQDADINLDETAITTSGEYDLVLGDGVGTETFTVQYNVIGLTTNTIQKDGASIGAQSDVEIHILDATGATVLGNLTGLTTDASGITGQTIVPAGAVDDSVRVIGYSDAAEIGFAYKTTLGLL